MKKSLFWFLVGVVLFFVGTSHNIFLMLFGMIMAGVNVVGAVKSLFSDESTEKGMGALVGGILITLFGVACKMNAIIMLLGITFTVVGILKALGLIKGEDDDGSYSDLWAVFDGDIMVSNPRYCSQAHKDWERLSKDPSFAGAGLTCKRVKKQG